jgi:WD40 repeat protein
MDSAADLPVTSKPEAGARDTGHPSGLDASGDLIGTSDGGLRCPAFVRPAPLVAGSMVPAQLCGVADAKAGTAFAYSPGKDVLAAGTILGNVRFFRGSDGTPQGKLAAHAGAIGSLAFSPDGTLFASADSSTEVKLWRFPSLELITTIPTTAVEALRVSRDGTLVAGYSKSETAVRIWKTDGTSVGTLSAQGVVSPPYSYLPETIDISPNGALLAAGGPHTTVVVWNIADQKLVTSLDADGAVEFSPDSKVLAAAGAGLAMFNVSDWTFVFPPKGGIGGTYGDPPGVTYSPDGTKVAWFNGGSGSTLSFVSTEDGSETPILDYSTRWVTAHIQFTADGKSLVTYGQIADVHGGAGVTLSSWETQSTTSPWKLPVLSVSQLDQIEFAADDSRFSAISTGAITTLCVGSLDTGVTLLTGSLTRALNGTPLLLSPDGQWVAVKYNYGGRTDILQTDTYSLRMSLSLKRDPLAFSPTEDLVVFGDDPTPGGMWTGFTLWSLTANQSVRDLKDAWGYANPALSPDGTQLAVFNGNHGANSYPIKILSTLTGAVTTTLPGAIGFPTLRFTSDGKRLLAGNASGTVLWDLATKVATPLPGATPPFAVSSSGMIATLGSGKVLLWTADGGPNGSLPGDSRSDIWSMAFSHDGATLAVGYRRGFTKLWCP